jgi:hypothetical protein
MNPISIHRAFDPQLDRILQDMEAAEAERLPSGAMGVLVVAALFTVPAWIVWALL